MGTLGICCCLCGSIFHSVNVRQFMASRSRERGAALVDAIEAEKEHQQRVARFFEALFVAVLGVAIARWVQLQWLC